jgi:hypothetical protein
MSLSTLHQASEQALPRWAIEAEAAALILTAGPVVLACVIAGFLWVPASARSFFGLDKAVDNIA